MRNSPNWEVVSQATLAVINFRYHPIGEYLSEKRLDEMNQYISEKIVASQEALLVTTILNDQTVLRRCLINPRTTMQDIKDTLATCIEIVNKKNYFDYRS
jgi:aromatic-L-amino-acid decarboxylase